MALQNARSKTSGSVPPSLADGQFAINMADEIFFYKNSGGIIKTLPFTKLARIGFTTVGDASYTILSTDRTIALTSTLTAARTLTLPAANSVIAGTSLRILDVKGSVSPTNTVTLATAGSDTLNGLTNIVFNSPYFDFQVTSDGTSTWTSGVVSVARGGTGTGTPGGTALDNITGFSSTGLLQRTGAGAYTLLAPGSGATLDTITGFSGTGLLTRTGTAAYSFTATANFASSGTTVTGVGGLTGGGALTGNQTISVALNGITNAMLAQMPTITIKGNVTGGTANASDLAPSAVLDAAFGTIQGTVLTRGASAWTAVGPGTAGQVLTSAGVGANPSFAAIAGGFPVTGVTAKSAAYTILASDKGTMFDLTGSFALTLPAASGGSTTTPLYFHFRKRDGGGQCTVAPNGTDTIEGVSASISLYQERATLVSFGSGWLFPPDGREKVVEVGVVSVSAGTSVVSLTYPYSDTDWRVIELETANLVISGGTSPSIVGAVQMNGSTSALPAVAFIPSGNSNKVGRSLVRNLGSAAAQQITHEGLTGVGVVYPAGLTTAGTPSGYNLTCSGGTSPTFSGLYNIRVYRK